MFGDVDGVYELPGFLPKTPPHAVLTSGAGEVVLPRRLLTS